MFLNGKIEWWNGNFYIFNYRISFTSYGKSKILKLLIRSNERSLVGNLPPKWKKSIYCSNNGITIYYWFVPLHRYRLTPTTHPQPSHLKNWLMALVVIVLLVAAAKILAVKVGTLTRPICLVLADYSVTKPTRLILLMFLIHVLAVLEMGFFQTNTPWAI